MKRNRFFTLKALAICFGFFSFFTSCKENTVINTDLIPEVDNINTFEKSADDLNIQMHVHLQDSIITGVPTFPIVGIGSLYNDPFYGNTSANLYFQVTIPRVDYTFPDSIQSLDSAFLVLPYSMVCFGDTNTAVNYSVYEITDPGFGLDTSDKQLYSFNTYTVDYTTELGSIHKLLKELKTDTNGYYSGDTFINQLKIPLNSAFANRIFTLSSSSLRNNGAFIEAFRGFYITTSASAPVSEQKGLHYFILDPSNSTSALSRARMELHYTFDNGNGGVTSFPFNPTASAFYTHVTRDRVGFPAAGYAEDQPTDSILVEGAPGFQTELTINNLNTIPKSIVNMARLEINVPLSVGYFLPPQLLLIKGVDSNGNLYEIADYKVMGNATSEQIQLANQFVGGAPTIVDIDGNQFYQYTLNIPREVQNAILNKQDKLKLRITAQNNYPAAFRIATFGKDNPGNERMKFKLIYTKI